MKKNNNPILNWFNNIKNTKKNIKIIKSSPYASMELSLKVRKMILIPLMIYILYRGYDMIKSYNSGGFMGLFGKAIMTGVIIYLVYRVYSTIPQAKKQLAYYRKYPHVINYCPTDVKEDINEILEKIKQNKLNKKEEKPNVKRKKTKSAGRNSTNSRKN